MWSNTYRRYFKERVNILRKIYRAISKKRNSFLENSSEAELKKRTPPTKSKLWKVYVESSDKDQILQKEFDCDSYPSQIKPTLQTLRLLGAFPLTLPRTGVPKFRFVSCITLYTVCFWIFIIATGYLSLCDRLSDYITKKGKFGISVYKVLHIIAVSHMPIVTVVTATDAKSFVRYMELWLQFQKLFNKVTSERLMLSVRKLCIYCNIFCCLAALGPFYLHFCPPYLSLINMPTYTFLAVITSTLKFLWFCNYKSLNNSNSCLVACFKRDLKRKRNTAQMIANYRILWLRLSQLVSETGGAICKIFVLYHIYVLLTLALSVYATVSGIRNTQDAFFRIIFVIAVTGFSGVPFFCLCNSADHLAQHMIKDIQQELELIMPKIGNNEILQQVNTFQLTIISNPPAISVYGFTVADRRLFKAYVSALLTYLIVLLQFDTVEPENMCVLNTTNISP